MVGLIDFLFVPTCVIIFNIQKISKIRILNSPGLVDLGRVCGPIERPRLVFDQAEGYFLQSELGLQGLDVLSPLVPPRISISFSEEMVGSFDFLFISRSFLGVRHSKDIKNSDIKMFGFVLYISKDQTVGSNVVPTQIYMHN